MNEPLCHAIITSPAGISDVSDIFEPAHDAGGEWQPIVFGELTTVDWEPDLGDTTVGWAVFNRGTPGARIEKIDERSQLRDDEAAVQWCIDHAPTDPRCLLALCETYATDDLVFGMVNNNLLRGGTR